MKEKEFDSRFDVTPETEGEQVKKQWYAVSTMPTHERKVKESLTKRAETMDISDQLLRVVLIEQPEIEIKNDKKVEVMKNAFPGYLFVEMYMTDYAWYIVRNTPGVTGFIGSSGKGAKPIPIKDDEMLRLLAMAGEEDGSLIKSDYKKGDIVQILSGPFAGMEATIDTINNESKKAIVNLIFFGRETSAEVEYTNMKKGE